MAIEQDDQRLRPEASEVQRLVADSTRLREATGWAPTLTLAEGLRRTIGWFSVPENLAGYKTSVYNV